MRRLAMIAAAVCMVVWTVGAESVAKITSFEGNVSILKKGAADWRDAKPGSALEVGDQVYTREESFAEIRYAIGTVLRMDEKTKVTIEESSEKTIRTKSGLGSVWVNMRKLISSGKQFEVATPTAVAAIRGTVFDFSYTPDSATYVNVFEGKVAVGPSDSLKKQLDQEKKKEQKKETVKKEHIEVPGPEEIPGPYEVSLEQWLTIVAGQKISVRKDGKFAREKMDMAAVQKEKFVKKNLELDKELMKEKVK
ncbi:MAG TPA: FecR family protein [Chitinivibrionales bacterium]|nr:FecR family protein [Chitinivibrionales bacterium]